MPAMKESPNSNPLLSVECSNEILMSVETSVSDVNVLELKRIAAKRFSSHFKMTLNAITVCLQTVWRNTQPKRKVYRCSILCDQIMSRSNGHSSIYICRMHRPTQNNASSVASPHRHTGIPDASLFPLEHKTILNWWKQACITRDVNDLCGLILDVRRNVNNLRSMVSQFEWLVNEWRTIFVM